MKKQSLILFCTLLFAFSLSAQNGRTNLDDVSFKEIKGTAKNALRLGDIYTALFYYEEWAERKPDDTKIIYQTAELYRLSRNYTQAEKWYDKVVSQNIDAFPLSMFHMATVQMSLEKYKEARSNFLKFKKLAKNVKDDKYRKLVKTGLLSCDYAMSIKDSSNQAVISHLDRSINQAHVEFSPVPVDDNKLIYGSLKENGVNFYDISKHDSMKIPLRKLYQAKKENGKWLADGEIKGPFNQEGTHVGNAVLSEDGDRMYFTLCKKNWQNKVICELYYTNKENGNWEEAIKMDNQINLSNYTCTQPAIGRESKKNQEVIYFVSDRPGGKGGLDIWYTEFHKKRKQFKAPRNAGSKINSVGTDCTPYYDMEAHRLYFSSDGLVGIGGLDVFVSNGEKNKWEEPQILGKEINSPADDIDFTLKKDRKGGFLVSNRKGGAALLSPTCCDDIYEFNYNKYIDINVKGSIKDSLECIENATLLLYIIDKESGEKYLSKLINTKDCDFNLKLEQGIDYSIEIKKEGYFNSVNELSTIKIDQSSDIEMNLNLKKIPKKAIKLEGINYEFNSAELTKEAKDALEGTLYQLLIDNPRLKIEVSAHTDNKGTEAYNLNLSKKRAKNVQSYLSKKGIDSNRIQASGYGESRPIAPNEKADGSDNPEGRAINRRTEFQVIGELDIEIEE